MDECRKFRINFNKILCPIHIFKNFKDTSIFKITPEFRFFNTIIYNNISYTSKNAETDHTPDHCNHTDDNCHLLRDPLLYAPGEPESDRCTLLYCNDSKYDWLW